MTKVNSELNFRGALVIPNGFIKGEVAGEEDCFFESVAQGLNELHIPGGPFNVKSLRRTLHDYAERNQNSVFDSRTGITLRKAIEDAAPVRTCTSGGRNEYTDFASYLVHIQLTAAERALLNLGAAMRGRPEIEGRMLCHIYGIKLHIIENFHSSGQEVIGHQLVESSGSKSLEEHSILYNDPQIIHILNEGLCHFVPIIRKTSVTKKTIEKETYFSPSEVVQSPDNPTGGLALHPLKSVAASPQKVCPLIAQTEHLEQGPEKIESATESKTHQRIHGRYLKEWSLTDKSAWSAVAAKKEESDFKILRITNSTTVSAALDFMQQTEFYETFNQASHWFFLL